MPVVCGFQGIAEDGTLTTLGRGGSDTTACALGVALAAEEVEIYTDVDGVMTADPRACDGAEVLEVIGADELFQMAKHGSRVVHTPAAELALASGLSVRVRNTYSDHPGTRVADIAGYRPAQRGDRGQRTSAASRASASTLAAAEGTPEHMAAQTRVYRAMADAGVSLDMFTPVGDDARLHRRRRSRSTPPARCSSASACSTRSRAGLAKVTLVGAGMHGVPGVMARMAEYLLDAGVNVLQTADSHTTISVLVPAERRRARGAGAPRRLRARRVDAMAREIVLYITASLDGFIADENGSVDWLGRRRGRGLRLRRPHGVGRHGPAGEPHLSRDHESRPTRTPTRARRTTSSPRATTCRSSARRPSCTTIPCGSCARLKAEGGCRIWLIGGGELASALVSAGLVDEIDLFVQPIVLGDGVPLWRPPLEHARTGAASRPGSGRVTSRSCATGFETRQQAGVTPRQHASAAASEHLLAVAQ